MKGRGVSKEVLIYSAGPWIEERQWTWRWLCVFAPVCVGGRGGGGDGGLEGVQSGLQL